MTSDISGEPLVTLPFRESVHSSSTVTGNMLEQSLVCSAIVIHTRKQACDFTSKWESNLEDRVHRTLFHVQVDLWKPGSVVQNGYPEQNLISVWRQKTRPYDAVEA